MIRELLSPQTFFFNMFTTSSTSSTYQWLFSLKIVLISTSMLSMAVILKLSAPAVTDFFLTEIPSIHSFLISWLRPPYLYLVINCIIISIVASSKLQKKLEGRAPVLAAALEMIAPPEAVKITDDVRTDYGGVVLNGYGYNYSNEIMNVVAKIVPDQVHAVDHVLGGVEVESVIPDRVDKIQKKTYEKPAMVRNDQEDEGVSRSMRNNTLQRKESMENILFSNEAEKPPASSRFSHRKTMKASPEGKALRVSKPKRHDTLENTWKTMTEGRPMPLTRHLKKSDTLEPHVRRNSSEEEEDQSKGMKKSETFSDVRSSGNSSLRREPSLGGPGRLKREPSLSQDELNRRVEAFINKVNAEMRLQKQESLNQYVEMMGRGAS